MSDYKFLGFDTPASVNTDDCTFSGNTITTTNIVANTGDAVYFKISDTKGAVGICQEDTRTYNVDTNIYSNVPSSFTPSVAYKFDVVDDLLSEDVKSYRFDTAVNIATYSESYRPYNTSFDYKLIVDNKRRSFNGEIKTLISSTWVVFVDTCEEYGYLVSFAEDSFVTLNNKFKSSIEFNIATR